MNSDKINKQPVSNIVWRHRDDLYANDYNPNAVAPPEHDLLEISLLEDGWTQPIVTRWDADNNRWEIVDGYNRWLMSGRPRVYGMTDGYVPTTIVVPKSRVDQQMSTIRHNRARGTHTVLKMSAILGEMVKEKIPMGEIMRRLGMEREEVLRLAQKAGIPQTDIITGATFGAAWVPE